MKNKLSKYTELVQNNIRCVFCHNIINPEKNKCSFCGQLFHETTLIQIQNLSIGQHSGEQSPDELLRQPHY